MYSVFYGIKGADLKEEENLKSFLLLKKMEWICYLEMSNTGGRNGQDKCNKQFCNGNIFY